MIESSTRNASTEFATALPLLSTVPAGFHCKFIVKAAATTNDYTITDHGSDTTKIICCGIAESATTTGTDGQYSATGTVLTFEGAGDISEPGDWVEVFSDGSSWYATGHAAAAIALIVG